MKKLILVLMLGILLVSFASAGSDVILTGKKGATIILPQECTSCTFVKINSIQYPNMSKQYINQDMSKNDSSFYYEFNDTTQLGTYNYCGYGDVSTTNTTYCYPFTITYLGKQLTTEKAIIYFIFLILFVLIFIGTFIAMGFLPGRNQRDEEGRLLSISYLKYVRNILYLFEWMLFIAILYLFSNLGFAFLEEELFSQTLFMLFKISFGLTPVIIIVWLIWIFVSMFHDKEFQNLLNRGMMPGDRI